MHVGGHETVPCLTMKRFQWELKVKLYQVKLNTAPPTCSTFSLYPTDDGKNILRAPSDSWKHWKSFRIDFHKISEWLFTRTFVTECYGHKKLTFNTMSKRNLIKLIFFVRRISISFSFSFLNNLLLIIKCIFLKAKDNKIKIHHESYLMVYYLKKYSKSLFQLLWRWFYGGMDSIFQSCEAINFHDIAF